MGALLDLPNIPRLRTRRQDLGWCVYRTRFIARLSVRWLVADDRRSGCISDEIAPSAGMDLIGPSRVIAENRAVSASKRPAGSVSWVRDQKRWRTTSLPNIVAE